MKSTLHTWRYFIALVGFAFLVALFYVEENWRARTSWERYQREAAAKGDPLDLKAMIQPPVPDDENFAMTPFLAPLFDFVPGTQRWRDQIGFSQSQNFASEFAEASSRVKQVKMPRTNSWIRAHVDLQAWAAALANAATNEHGPGVVPVSNPPPKAIGRVENPSHDSEGSTREAAQAVLAALEQYDPVLDELRAASRRPFSRFNIRYEESNPAGILLPHLARLKQLAQLTQLRACAQLGAGQPDAAFADIDLLFCLTDSVRSEPILISHLVRISLSQIALQPVAEGLASRQWSDTQLAEIQNRLSRLDFLADGRRALRGERNFGVAIIEYLRTTQDRFQALNAVSSGTGAARRYDIRSLLLAAVPDGWFHLEELSICRMFDEEYLPAVELQDGRLSPRACRAAEARIQAMTKGSPISAVVHHRYFVGLLMPALGRAVEKSAYAQASVDAAVIACALERCRLAQGHYPESLELLEPRFVDRLPRDIISGQPLKYHRNDDGTYVLYGVGWNETDDSGQIAVSGSGESADLEKGDWVWRLQVR